LSGDTEDGISTSKRRFKREQLDANEEKDDDEEEDDDD
jgi:hypothetical protein